MKHFICLSDQKQEVILPKHCVMKTEEAVRRKIITWHRRVFGAYIPRAFIGLCNCLRRAFLFAPTSLWHDHRLPLPPAKEVRKPLNAARGLIVRRSYTLLQSE